MHQILLSGHVKKASFVVRSWLEVSGMQIFSENALKLSIWKLDQLRELRTEMKAKLPAKHDQHLVRLPWPGTAHV